MYKFLNVCCLLLLFCACQNPKQAVSQPIITEDQSVQIVDYPTPGAAQFDQYLQAINGKRVGIVVNKASRVGESHLLDALLHKGVNVAKIYAPEHGFRGDADAGAVIKDGKDTKTGLPINSLYGKNKKPNAQQLSGIDVMLFDLQDVGARFYTYISTLHYVMEACTEQEIPVIVLDRPNPNGFYVAGPIREEQYKSFVGMHPVPIVYGMTIGEYAQMINGEHWLDGGVTCDLTVVKCPTYRHNTTFSLPVAPSPNLPNLRSVLLYPSLCLFEGSVLSIGRGTEQPFQQIGHPNLSQYEYSFVPKSGYGAKYPKHENKYCFGLNLADIPVEDIVNNTLNWNYLSELYRACRQANVDFFNDNNFFEKLGGTIDIRNQLVNTGHIDASKWQADLDTFKQTRAKYLLYTD